MKQKNLCIVALFTFLLLSCTKDNNVQPIVQSQSPANSLHKIMPMNPTVIWGIWGAHSGHLGYTNASGYLGYTNKGFSRQVAHIGWWTDLDPNSSNLKGIITLAADSGYNFFLYEFPTEWIKEISASWARDYVKKRIDTITALQTRINKTHNISCNVYIDDISQNGYTSNQLSILKGLLVPSGQKIYGATSNNVPALSFVDVVMPDCYGLSIAEKHIRYKAIADMGKPMEIWVSIEPVHASDAQTIANELGLACAFTNNIWIFADAHGDVNNHSNNIDLIDIGQYAKFEAALQILWNIPAP
jgi:hypothetical protein